MILDLNVTASGSQHNTVPSLPNIGDSYDEEGYEDEEAYEDYDEEEGYEDEEGDEVVYERKCKLTLSEPFKSPLSKGVCFWYCLSGSFNFFAESC